MKRTLLLSLLLALGVVAYGGYRNAHTPGNLYFKTLVFASCSPPPNCVSSVAHDDHHRVPVLGYIGDPYTAVLMLKEVILGMSGKIERETPEYIHAVFESQSLGLRDDLELLVLPGGSIEVRSASRVQLNDGGGNRARVEQLRRAFEAMP